MNEKRTPKFQRNLLLESLLNELNGDLQPAEEALLQKAGEAEMPAPLVLVMGPLRSGTTLFTQWLANTGLVAYPTNLLSRFYRAPIIGAKIQLLLTDPRYNFRDELGEFAAEVEFASENGKTKGVLAPNEFWYFWRRFLSDPSRDVWSDEDLRSSMDVATLKAELSGMMAVFEKPFAAKGMLFNYNIPFLNEVLDKAVFVQIVRDEVSNTESVLDARIRQLGSADAWYSFEIPEYEELRELPAVQQAAGQVRAINRAVTRGLQGVTADRKLVVRYEDFCSDPAAIYGELSARLCPGQEPAEYQGAASFSLTRQPDAERQRQIREAIEQLAARGL